MANKKHGTHAKSQSAHKRPSAQTPQGKSDKLKHQTQTGSSKKLWIIAAVAVVAVIAIVVLASGGGGGGTVSGAPTDEAKYIGRLLPAGYVEPKPVKRAIYTSAISQSNVTATDEGAQISIPVSDVTSKKIVSFAYQRQGADAIPLIAYVKPSGKVFVGVNFCPPCKGEGQTIEPDLTLNCTTCGTKRSIETQIGVSGACKLYPLDELPSKIVGDKLVVQKATMDAWSPQPLDRKIGG